MVVQQEENCWVGFQWLIEDAEANLFMANSKVFSWEWQLKSLMISFPTTVALAAFENIDTIRESVSETRHSRNRKVSNRLIKTKVHHKDSHLWIVTCLAQFLSKISNQARDYFYPLIKGWWTLGFLGASTFLDNFHFDNLSNSRVLEIDQKMSYSDTLLDFKNKSFFCNMY